MNTPPDAEVTSDRIITEQGLAPCSWQFPHPSEADSNGLVAIGGDLEAQTLIWAYCHGLFPMPLGRRRRLGWWSPEPRAVLSLDALRRTRSLTRSLRRFEVRVDTSFEAVMRACSDPRRPHGWITEDFVAAYVELHRRGFAHSVEAFQNGELVGGLYGVMIGGLFAGESMFQRSTDASKVALVALVDLLNEIPDALLDVQWLTPHLASLGATEIPRPDYLTLLAASIARPTTELAALSVDRASRLPRAP